MWRIWLCWALGGLAALWYITVHPGESVGAVTFVERFIYGFAIGVVGAGGGGFIGLAWAFLSDAI